MPRSRMEADGADIIDIGGESTRPGAAPVSRRRGAARGCCRCSSGSPGACASRSRSTPTRRTSPRAALDAGAAIVNDVSGLRYDPALGGVVAAARRRAGPDAHARAVAATCTARRATTTWSTRWRASCGERVGAATRPASRRERLARRSRARVCQARRSTAMVCWRGSRVARRARPPAARRAVAQVVPDARPSATAPAAERDWATAAAVTAAVLRRRAHRPRPRGGRDGAGRARGRRDSRRGRALDLTTRAT